MARDAAGVRSPCLCEKKGDFRLKLLRREARPLGHFSCGSEASKE